ncbi:MAG TPA: hypothetical protein VK961_23675, partial [Chthoniobacter sp.]|nr:hypothetical protein [Chthoniobacter sp.]
MPEFFYRARSFDGQVIDGSVTTVSRAAAIAMVEALGVVPISIKADGGAATIASARPPTTPVPKKSGSSVVKTSWSARALGRGEDAKKIAAADAGAVTSRDRLSFGQQHLFTEQLAHLLGAGLTLDESL